MPLTNPSFLPHPPRPPTPPVQSLAPPPSPPPQTSPARPSAQSETWFHRRAPPAVFPLCWPPPPDTSEWCKYRLPPAIENRNPACGNECPQPCPPAATPEKRSNPRH